jgi:conjugative relaxase-like TrwC/TraI family protein
MVMTRAKITAGDGYMYLIRHVANGDSGTQSQHAAAAYYTAQGNPPGRWIGRGIHLIGLEGQQVTEQQMRDLFGLGMHPNADAMIAAYLKAHISHGMTERQRAKVTAAAIRHATLGSQFPAFKDVGDYDDRVAQRLKIIEEETKRAPTQAEISKVHAEEARRQRVAVAGFDLVFSPVKSAALLWALDERQHVRDAIRQAHENAMREALDLLEDHVAYTRTGAGGIAQINTNGLMAAAFEHWESRAGDPNLHTHVAISSKVQGSDGKWRALDARPLYRATVAVSEAYNTAFEAHLTAALGVTFTTRPDTVGGREPVREIDGVPFGMIDYFSRRRAAIEKRYDQLVGDYRDRHGHDPPAGATHDLARQANLDTRQGKKPPRSLASKRAAWRAELNEAFGPGAAARLMAAIPARPRPPSAPDPPVDPTPLAERTVSAVALRRSTWTPWNIRAEAERQLRTQTAPIPPERHRQLIDAITALALSPKYSVCVEAPALLDEPPELRRPDGEPVFAEHGSARYTSQAVLDAEQRLLNATRTLTVYGLSGLSVATAISGFERGTGTRLDDGQRHLVTAFASDERLLLAGIGPAGSGKTTAMRAYAHVLRHAGRHLIPLATSAAAADVLGRELGVQADNLHKFLHEWTVGRFSGRLRAGGTVPSQVRMFALRPGDVVLVDEAGMAGTLLLDQLVQVAAARGAVVRLLGDHRQLPAVESGGALRLIAAQPGTPELSVLYRFRDPAEATATLQLRVGDAAAIDWYAGHDRIRAGSRDHMTQAAYGGWKADMLAGKITLMAAASNPDVTALSARARTDRVQVGQVDPDGAALHDGNLAGQGDWIVTRANDRRMSACGGRDWVKNGDAWHVERRHPDGSLSVRGMAHGGRVRLPAAYVARHVELLYATTAHRAQGSTVDTAHPLITAGMTRESLYVLASRARERTTFYVATHDQPFDEDDRVDLVRTDPRARVAREILTGILATESAALSATETITAAQEEAGSLATLVPRYEYAARHQAEHRYEAAATQALGGQAGADLQADPAWPQVVRRLQDAEACGWDPARLLVAVAAQRELGTADSAAEVLAWRLDGYLAGNDAPPRNDRPYEPAATAKNRLTEIAKAALGPQASQRAESEPAWPALIVAIQRVEAAGLDPADLLTQLARLRELRTARSISEDLAVRINCYLSAHPDAAGGGAKSEPVLPWLATPRASSTSSTELARYLTDAASLITSRVDELASVAVRHRPPWMQALGYTSGDPESEREWLSHVAVVAAYRDQFSVRTSDPSQPLGPYAESGTPAHKPYWHAAESIVAAGRLVSIEAPTATPTAEARAQVARDIYDCLPEAECAAISGDMAKRLGLLWFGNPATPDANSATRLAHGPALVTTLAEHGYMTTAEPVRRQPMVDESAEVTIARPGIQGRPRLAPSRARTATPTPTPRQEPIIGPASTPAAGPQIRLR